jgi:tetratricopeptide (TPR) repeat protein
MARWRSVNSRSNRFVSLGALALLAGCHSAPVQPPRAPATVPPASAATASAPSGTSQAKPAILTGAPASANSSGNVSGAAAAAPVNPASNAQVDSTPIPPRAAQQYSQALQMMKSNRRTDAELEFKQLTVAYPQYAGPQLNLGLLYLNDSRLPEAEAAFKAALQTAPSSAIAGDELGIVERKLGKFAESEAAYLRAIAAEPNYAPAHLNLGVLYDLYLAEPQKALEQFERYIELAGENKQVSGWVIELRKRVGAPAQAVKKEPA